MNRHCNSIFLAAVLLGNMCATIPLQAGPCMSRAACEFERGTRVSHLSPDGDTYVGTVMGPGNLPETIRIGVISKNRVPREDDDGCPLFLYNVPAWALQRIY